MKLKKITLCSFIFIALNAQAKSVDIDIGHSIKKGGSVSVNGIQEFYYNKALAINVDRELRAINIDTKLIGETGEADQLMDRTLNNNGNLFVSIHHDSIKADWMPYADQFKGFSIFVSRKNKHFNQSVACAKMVGKSLINAGFKPSGYHAMDVDGERKSWINETLGVHLYDNLVVLKHNKNPAILIEAAVIVNQSDVAMVSSQEGQVALSKAISHGISQCI